MYLVMAGAGGVCVHVCVCVGGWGWGGGVCVHACLYSETILAAMPGAGWGCTQQTVPNRCAW